MKEKNIRRKKSDKGYSKIFDSNGTFTGRYKFDVTIKGKRFRKTIKVKPSVVKTVFSEWYRQKENEANGGPKNYKLFDKLDEFLIFLKNRKKKLSDSTFRSRQFTVTLLKEFFTENTLLKDVSRAEIEDFLIFRRTRVLNGNRTGKKTIADSTININIESISVFFNYCIDRNYYQKNNPARALKTSYVKREIELTKEQRQELIDKANDQMKVIISIGIYAGLRRKEICGLEWEHIDFDKKVISLPGRITKGNYDASVTIPDILVNILLYWKSVNPNTTYVINFKHNGLVTYAKRMDCFGRYWNNFRDTLSFQLPKIAKLHYHDLRHEFANDMLTNDVPLSVLQRQMRHKSLFSSEKYLSVKKQVEHSEIKDKFTSVTIKMGNKNRQDIGNKKIESQENVKLTDYISRNFGNIVKLRDFVKQLKAIA